MHKALSNSDIAPCLTAIMPVYNEASTIAEVIRSEQTASVTLLQRRIRLGYTRAARIMDELEGLGIVGPSKGAEPRDILIRDFPFDLWFMTSN